MSNAIKASVDSVLGILDIANYLRGIKKAELRNSRQERRSRIEASPQFYNGKAINKMPDIPHRESSLSLMSKFVFQRSTLKPACELPYKNVDLDVLNKRSELPRVTWLGHSSLYIDMNHTRLLIDPVFGFASPLIAKPFFNRNVMTPIAQESMPLPDVIVISHDHYDHLEKSTIKYFADKPVRFFVPLGVGRHLENWGIRPDRIKEFDWWESAIVNGIRLTATPANHNSGRTGIDSNRTLWCSWAIQSDKCSLFFSGDSAYDSHFKQIRERLGKFDMAFLEVAANVKNGKGFPVETWGHMQAAHTIQAFKDLEAKRLFPVHWATFELFSHRWDEPMEDLITEAMLTDAELVTPMIGQSIDPIDVPFTSYWWREEQSRSHCESARTDWGPAY